MPFMCPRLPGDPGYPMPRPIQLREESDREPTPEESGWLTILKGIVAFVVLGYAGVSCTYHSIVNVLA